MQKISAHVFSTLSLSTAMAVVATAAGPAGEAAIQKLANEEVEAWNAGDARAYSRHFAPEGTFTNIYGMVFDGHDAFEKRHAESFATFFKGSRLHSCTQVICTTISSA